MKTMLDMIINSEPSCHFCVYLISIINNKKALLIPEARILKYYGLKDS